MTKVCIYGLGYIGLPTALVMADNDVTVIGVDKSLEVVDAVNACELHIVEKGLKELLSTAVLQKRLVAQAYPSAADVHIICVPTPCRSEDNLFSSDMSFVETAIRDIATVFKEGDLLILESTVSVGASAHMETLLKQIRPDLGSINIVYCPERVLPGNLLFELRHNERIIGGNCPDTNQRAKNFYEKFVSGKIYKTDLRTAELSKLVENSYRDVNIAFANELSIICENQGINVYELIDLVNKHPRVNVLQPGIGVGGHCIAVDPWFIVENDRENSLLIKLARERNLYKTDFILNKVYRHIFAYETKKGNEPIIGFLGLSYKPDIDDLRESPAVSIVREVQLRHSNVYVAEPNLKCSTEFNLKSISDVIKDCDLIFGLVAHSEFIDAVKSRDFERSKFIDFCGISKLS